MAEPLTEEHVRAIARAELAQLMTPLRLEQDELARQLRILVQLVRGDETIGFAGLLRRLDFTDGQIKMLIAAEEARTRRDEQLKARMSGLTIGVTLSTLTGAGTLAAVARLLLGGGP